jgi:molybdopterin/thiamine biosynthesis adenylyltransferase/nitroreductase
MVKFTYDAAFERNVGWLTEAEQLALRGMRIALAGMGGVGGVHMITLARLGVGAFNIADFDRFDIPNFNRQYGCNVNTIGLVKSDVMEEMALAVNPELRIRRFDEGVTDENLEQFLHDVDLFVDGFDFNVIEMRRKTYRRCRELGIPVVCAGPIGMGVSLLAFDPKGMSFDEYFGMEGAGEFEQLIRFMTGLVPKPLPLSYLSDPMRLNLVAKTATSVGAACQLCAGAAAITALKFLLRRGEIKPVPYAFQYDIFSNRLVVTKVRGGLNGARWRRRMARMVPETIERMRAIPLPPATFVPEGYLDEVLHAARWAPSRGNEQPWRFEKLGPDELRINAQRTTAGGLYQYRDGEPNLLAIGGLLEYLRIAASAHGRRMAWRIESDADPLLIRAQFAADLTTEPDPLCPSLGLRHVDRTRYLTRPLTAQERQALEAKLGENLRVIWLSDKPDRKRFARLSLRAGTIRLRSPEMRPVHQRRIEWTLPISADRTPAKALGLDPIFVRVYRWVLASKVRTRWFNQAGGAAAMALETDYMPVLASGAVFAIRYNELSGSPQTTHDLLETGIKIQNFWLAATRLGLALQPLMDVLTFAHYGQDNAPFTVDARLQGKGRDLAQQFRDLFRADTGYFVFMGRIGEPHRRGAYPRSVRKPVAELLTVATNETPGFDR